MPRASDRADTEKARSALRACPLLYDASAKDIAILAQDVGWVRIGADELLFDKGDIVDSLFALVSGRLVVYDPVSKTGELEVWGQVLPGEFVGILSVVRGTRRGASCRAQRDSVLLRIPRLRFLDVAQNSSGIMSGLNRLIVERFQGYISGNNYRQSRLVVGVVPVSANAPVARLCDELVTEMASFVSVLHVRDSDVQQRLGRDPRTVEFGSEAHGQLSNWLLEEESRHDVIVLQSQTGDDNWTRLCVRQADTVLLVGRATEQPASIPTYDRLFTPSEVGAADRRELLLVHADNASIPRGTRRWLEVFPIDMHHHIRAGQRADIRRVARFLTGNAVSVSLSGGAARAFAHVGVLRAMEEMQIPVDAICGTSMGALFAGLYALNWDSERIRGATRELFVEKSVYDFTVPIVGMISGRRYERHLASWFMDTNVEDLWRPFFCVSADLRSAEAVVHERGSVRQAVRCSGSVPGLFPPVTVGNRLLVDGGMLDNLPAERALQRSQGKSIAVSAIQGFGQDIWSRLTGASKPLQVARATMRPRRGQWLPPVMEISMQSMFMATISAAEKVRHKVDLFIEPPVAKYGFLDSSVIDTVVEVGYQEGKKRLAAWRERDPEVAKL